MAAEDTSTASLPQVESVPGLRTYWDFNPSPVSLRHKWQRLTAHLWRRVDRPSYKLISKPYPAKRWNLYFVYCPDGTLSAAHRYTLDSLRSTGHPLLIVCGTSSPEKIPAELQSSCDALYWKDLPGYDFSAFRVALEAICEYSPGATVFMMNDSVFGPFSDINPYVEHAPWELTGFSASSLGENHIQSFAFIVKNLTGQVLKNFDEVFLPDSAYNELGDVILSQELKLARVGSYNQSVGSYWYNPDREGFDPMLHIPFDMVNAGLPFLKRSLLGKMSKFQNPQEVREFLLNKGHPAEPAK